MKRIGNSFVAVLRSPFSAPHMLDQIRLELSPHSLGGYLVEMQAEGRWDSQVKQAFATATDLRDLSAMFAAAAEVLAAKAAA